MLEILDAQLAAVDGIRPENKPVQGWLKTVRESLGVTLKNVAQEEGMSAAAVSKLERSEAAGTITILTAARLADLLGCKLIYAPVSRDPRLNSVIQTASEYKANPPDYFKEAPTIPELLKDSLMPPGGWIKALRTALGLSTSPIAEVLKIHPSVVYKMEAGEAVGRIRINTLRKLAQAMHGDIAYFIAPAIAPTFTALEVALRTPNAPPAT